MQQPAGKKERHRREGGRGYPFSVHAKFGFTIYLPWVFFGGISGLLPVSDATKIPGPRPGRTRWAHPSDHRHHLRAPWLPHRPPSRSQLHRLEVGQNSTSFLPSEVMGNGHLQPVPVNCVSRQTSCCHAFRDAFVLSWKPRTPRLGNPQWQLPSTVPADDSASETISRGSDVLNHNTLVEE